MDIIFATTNQNKVKRIKNFMYDTNYKFHTLDEYEKDLPEPEEDQNSPLEIAKNKAAFYYDSLDNNLPVLAQDDTIMIYISDKPEEILSIKQPVKDKYGEFNDADAIKYYTELAAKHGGEIKLEFHYGFGLATDQGIKAAPAILSGMLTAEVSDTVQPGYFLTAIFKTQTKAGKMKYMSEMNEEENAYADRDLRKNIINLLEGIK